MVSRNRSAPGACAGGGMTIGPQTNHWETALRVLVVEGLTGVTFLHEALEAFGSG